MLPKIKKTNCFAQHFQNMSRIVITQRKITLQSLLEPIIRLLQAKSDFREVKQYAKFQIINNSIIKTSTIIP